MKTLRMTLHEYEALRASLPRGPLGAIWPGGQALVAIIVADPVVNRIVALGAWFYAVRARS